MNAQFKALLTAAAVLASTASMAQTAQPSTARGGSVQGSNFNIVAMASEMVNRGLSGRDLAGRLEAGYGPLSLTGRYSAREQGLTTEVINGQITVGDGSSVSGSEFRVSATSNRVQTEGAVYVNGQIKVGS